MGARMRDIGLLNLPKITLGSIECMLLFLGRLTLFLKERVIAMFHLHQVVDHRSKLLFESLGIQTLGNLSDSRLEPGFRGLIMFHLAPSADGDGGTLFFRQQLPLPE